MEHSTLTKKGSEDQLLVRDDDCESAKPDQRDNIGATPQGGHFPELNGHFPDVSGQRQVREEGSKRPEQNGHRDIRIPSCPECLPPPMSYHRQCPTAVNPGSIQGPHCWCLRRFDTLRPPR